MLKEWKDGEPRASYRMIVVVRKNSATIMIGPSPEFKPEEATAATGTDATGARVPLKYRKSASDIASSVPGGNSRNGPDRRTDQIDVQGKPRPQGNSLTAPANFHRSGKSLPVDESRAPQHPPRKTGSGEVKRWSWSDPQDWI
eukprot:jgi/Botrbrau1/22528/Bobra.114_2s0052.1